MASQCVSAENTKRPTKLIRPRPKKATSSSSSSSGDGCETGSGTGSGDSIKKDEPQPPCNDILSSQVEIIPHEPAMTYYCDPELFVKRQIRRTVSLPFYKITNNAVLTQILRNELAKMVEGRCSIEGYICPNSISIASYSSGRLSAANVLFDITADCLVCFPDEHAVIKCIAKTTTQAGIRAGARYLENGHVSPIEVFLSRDMHASSRELFSRVEEHDVLTVKIIGRRFVLNDTHVTIVAMLMNAENP